MTAFLVDAGRALLWLAAPDRDRATIPGDLEEEMRIRVDEGSPEWSAAWWFFRQAANSLLPLLAVRWRQGEFARLALVSLLAFGVPVRLLDLLWTFVLSQVPLKADAMRPDGMVAASLVTAVACAACAGYAWARECRGSESRAGMMCALMSAALQGACLAVSAARWPAWFMAASMCAAAAASAAGSLARRWQIKKERTAI
ncbi:MAG: hypothetical protein FJW39_19800 [Acidobacteria bacterium]|nr:hypothetical protein [Acidobacteriota bacterium]